MSQGKASSLRPARDRADDRKAINEQKRLDAEAARENKDQARIDAVEAKHKKVKEAHALARLKRERRAKGLDPSTGEPIDGSALPVAVEPEPPQVEAIPDTPETNDPE